MAELNEAESTKDTKKTKKEKKMEEKAAKKAAKKAKKNHEADKPDAENDDSDSVSSKIVMVLVTILIIAIWLGIFAVFVKADVGGFGSTVLAPALKDVPVLSKILPDSGNITASESTETAGYTNLDDAVSRIKELEKQNPRRMVAKIAGGAKMFEMSGNSTIGNVGDRNTDMARHVLAELKIPLKAQDTGLNYGRTVILDCETGDYIIKAVGKEQKVI